MFDSATTSATTRKKKPAPMRGGEISAPQETRSEATLEEVQDLMPAGWGVAQGKPDNWRSYPPTSLRKQYGEYGTNRSKIVYGSRTAGQLLAEHAWSVNRRIGHEQKAPSPGDDSAENTNGDVTHCAGDRAHADVASAPCANDVTCPRHDRDPDSPIMGDFTSSPTEEAPMSPVHPIRLVFERAASTGKQQGRQRRTGPLTRSMATPRKVLCPSSSLPEAGM